MEVDLFIQIMDIVPSKQDSENQTTSILLPSVATAESPLAFCSLRTPLLLPKQTKSDNDFHAPHNPGDLSKQKAPEITSPGCQNEVKTTTTINSNGEKSKENSSKRSRVQRFSLDKYQCKASLSVIPASFKHRALACQKAMKLGPRTYRGARKITEKLCKAHLQFLKNHVKEQSDLLGGGETFLHEIATAHPKYNQMIRALPMLINFVPEELKEKLLIKENMELLKIGAFLVNKWVSRSA